MMATNALFSRRLWSEKDDEIAHVLAVDDSLVDRKVIERLLKTSSCKVTAVDSGMRALEFLGLDEEKQINNAVDKLKVDLIITDYCMPGMTGYDLLKKIKESSAFREVPVVIMSSENVLTRIHRCLEEGAEDFIVKPVKLSDVERLRENLMAKNKPENTFNERAPISHKRKLSEGPDLSTSPNSSKSPSSIASPISSPDFTPSPPSSSRSSPSPPIPTPSEPLDSPSRKQKISDTINEIIPESPL